MLSTVEGVFDAWSETDPGYDHLLGMYAFALNECGRYEAAERIGRTAVELNPEDLWSVHSVAHALEMQGDLSAGVELFDVDPAIWATKNPFIGHIWWHSALFRWNAGDYDRVLDVYDERLQPASTDFYLDIQNMSSLLVRLEYVGVDVGDRWDEISEHAAARVGDHVLAFTDAHCVLTLARTGRLDDLDAFMSSLDESRSRGSGGSAPVAVTATDTVIELGRGLAAMGRGEHERAAEVIGAISGDLAPIGGSHAQRDLFDLVLEDCAERAGDLDMALQLLRARSRRWPNSVPTWTRYSNVLQSAGHVSLADDAHRRAMEVTRP
jgi:tetratricopeptide (TPR) repeat protein